MRDLLQVLDRLALGLRELRRHGDAQTREEVIRLAGSTDKRRVLGLGFASPYLRFSLEKAERVLGYQPKYSTAEAMVRNYDWYIAHLHEFEHASGVSHRVPWNQGILKVAKLFF